MPLGSTRKPPWCTGRCSRRRSRRPGLLLLEAECSALTCRGGASSGRPEQHVCGQARPSPHAPSAQGAPGRRGGRLCLAKCESGSGPVAATWALGGRSLLSGQSAAMTVIPSENSVCGRTIPSRERPAWPRPQARLHSSGCHADPRSWPGVAPPLGLSTRLLLWVWLLRGFMAKFCLWCELNGFKPDKYSVWLWQEVGRHRWRLS